MTDDFKYIKSGLLLVAITIIAIYFTIKKIKELMPREKHQIEVDANYDLFLCSIHPINSSPNLRVVVFAKDGDHALQKCKLTYGIQYVGTYTKLDGLIK